MTSKQKNPQYTVPEEIISACMNGKLSIFAGAGISTESRNISSLTLYESAKAELKEKDDLSFPDLMHKYVQQPNGRKKLMFKIWEKLDLIKSFPHLYNEATKFHKNLSQIYQIKEIFTTNWDMYFEEECNAIPIVRAKDCIFYEIPERKVFKLHGSISDYATIVASKEDYKKRYKDISQGLMGSRLKTALGTQTVIFFGYSFSDFDLNNILDFIASEMDEYLPVIYIVTRSGKINAHKKVLRKTKIIQDDATNFIIKLRNELEKKGALMNTDNFPDIPKVLKKIKRENEILQKISKNKYPESIYSLAYQKALTRSFEKIIAKKNSGAYNYIPFIERELENLDNLLVQEYENKEYIRASYVLGYRNALKYLLSDENTRKLMPIYFFIDYEGASFTISDFKNMHNKADHLSKEAYVKAEQIVRSNTTDDALLYPESIIRDH